MRFTFRLLAAIAAVALSVGAANAAPILLDNFSQPAGGQSVNSGSLSGSFAGTVLGGSGLGTRNVTYSGTNINTGNTWRTGVETLDINSAAFPGRLALATFDSGVQVDLKYSSFGTVNLSGNPILALVFNTIFDKGANATFDVSVILTTSTGTLSGNFAVPAGFVPNGGTLNLSLLALTGLGNLNSVSAIQINLNNNGSPSPGADFALDQVEFRETPEPASIAVFGVLALGGLAVARRKFLAKRETA